MSPIPAPQKPRPRRSSQQRRRALRHGMWAEWLAAFSLLCKGYHLLAYRYAGHGGEIDLVMRRKQVIAFVEVKYRAGHDQALTAIDAGKQSRFNKAVNLWLMRNGWAQDHVLRGDAVLVVPWHWPRHIEDAFTLAE